MAYRRTLISEFSLANPLYAYATIYVYGVTGGAKDTSIRPTLYDASVGGDTLANPQKLDEHGRWKQPVYVDVPAIVEAVPLHAASHDTGIIRPALDDAAVYEAGMHASTAAGNAAMAQDAARNAKRYAAQVDPQQIALIAQSYG